MKRSHILIALGVATLVIILAAAAGAFPGQQAVYVGPDGLEVRPIVDKKKNSVILAVYNTKTGMGGDVKFDDCVIVSKTEWTCGTFTVSRHWQHGDTIMQIDHEKLTAAYRRRWFF